MDCASGIVIEQKSTSALQRNKRGILSAQSVGVSGREKEVCDSRRQQQVECGGNGMKKEIWTLLQLRREWQSSKLPKT